MKKGPQDNADFNKKRKEHYRNEFRIAVNGASKVEPSGPGSKLIEESKSDGEPGFKQ